MANRCTYIPQIMLPREGCDLSKWAVIACDQYTSQPEYWAEADRIVGTAPSAPIMPQASAHICRRSAYSKVSQKNEAADGTGGAPRGGAV